MSNDTNAPASPVPGGWSWPEDLPEYEAISEPVEESILESANNAEDQTPPHPEDARPTSHTSGRHWRPRQCRICLEQVLPTFHPPNEHLPAFLAGGYVNYASESGRLIRPCQCKGSSRYVHEQCLQEWRHSDRSYTSRRRYFDCPTCGFSYRMERLTWARYISSTASQMLLTLAIFFVTVFVLGFIGDFIINLYLDPYDVITSIPLGSGDDSAPFYLLEEEDATWIEHFIKGFASLGLLGFAKVMLANPWNWYNVRRYGTGGGRAGTTGRDRLTNVSMIAVAVGIFTVIFALWKGVRAWSKRFMEKAGERVLDVQGDDFEDDEEDGDEDTPPATAQ